jgi:hypothetical protein
MTDPRAEDVMKPALRSLVLIGVALVLCQGAAASETKILRKVNEPTAQRLAAEAVYRGDKYLEFFEYDDSMSSNFSPPFLVFQGASKPPAEGSFGFFAVNPWTGDVWNLWGCHRLSTPILRKSQAAIRREFTREELKQYARLRRLKPVCVVED